MTDDTIYAVSSGRPPAAIAIMRISGPNARDALGRLVGKVPPPRVATLAAVRSASDDVLDHALILWFEGPASATGEDVAELHLHGGIAIVDAVSHALVGPGLRRAEPGEFTRRAFLNGRLDLNEAEGLADLLAAETESQRREAMTRATGHLGRELGDWTARLLVIAAEVERTIDHDEDDIGGAHRDVEPDLRRLRDDIAAALSRPHAERLHDGIRVAIVGPVNAGKSSLFNALLGMDAAIVSPVAGTTRDAIERTVAFGGTPFILIDTAGLRTTSDPIEAIGIERARDAARDADIVLDLADDAVDAECRIAIAAKADLLYTESDRLSVSATTGQGLTALIGCLQASAADMLPRDGESALNERLRSGLLAVVIALGEAISEADPLIRAEHLRAGARQIDLLTGRAGVEAVLDTLFARFCVGK